MSRETVIEETVSNYATFMGFEQRKVIYAGRRGSPDRWYFGRGYVFCVEFKRPGEKPDAQQLREHTRLRNAGIPVYVCSNIDQGKAIVDAFSALAPRALPSFPKGMIDAA